MTAGVAALVLAGGRARRLGGGDKTLLIAGGKPLLGHILQALGGLPVAISANGDPRRFAAFGLPVLDDGAFPGQGPLAGVLAGLTWAAALGAETLLTVPGDTPLIPVDLARRLSPAPACATSRGRLHHLVALWPVTCRDSLFRSLARPGPRHVARFAATLRMREVAFAAEPWDPFDNANTQEDLARIRAVIQDRDKEGMA
jgi:molybdopterin-guanine dinucleotide biosynthesis protein A